MLAVAALVVDAAGAHQIALDLLLVAIVLAAVAGLETVAAVVDGDRSRTSAVLVGLALLSLVAAGATNRLELALGCVACAALDRLRLRVRVRDATAVESP